MAIKIQTQKQIEDLKAGDIIKHPDNDDPNNSIEWEIVENDPEFQNISITFPNLPEKIFEIREVNLVTGEAKGE